MEQHKGLLLQLFNTLKSSGYLNLQYIPTRKSIFGLFKEYENLANLSSRKKHLMYYYSYFPSFYLKKITKNDPALNFYFNFCFKNKTFSLETIKTYLGNEWTANAVSTKLLNPVNGEYMLLYSILPIYNYLILRDNHYSYQYFETDGEKPENRVHVGADSVKFAAFNQKYLKGKNFKNTLELGCGTGIQLICAENFSEKLTGIDINPRAVDFTRMTAELNGLGPRFTVILSDLFANLNDKYDLILANPWFVDLEKGGLEEIPDIIEQLDNFLLPGGTYAMYFGSFVKNGVDLGQTLMTKFAQEKGYTAIFHQLGRSVEPLQLDEFRKNGISHIQSYVAYLTKNGSSSIKVIKPGVTRRIRDSIYLPLQWMLGKKSKKDLI